MTMKFSDGNKCAEYIGEGVISKNTSEIKQHTDIYSVSCFKSFTEYSV